MIKPMSTLFLIGVSGEEFPAEAATVLATCRLVVGVERHRHLVSGRDNCRFVAITPLAQALHSLAGCVGKMDVAVLASGDPLFFGIGKLLVEKFQDHTIRIFPALTSMQLAFSRFQLSWDDAKLISLHGRKADPLPLLLPHHKVGLLTDNVHSPPVVARELLDAFRAIDDVEMAEDYQVMVAENLGLAEERLTKGSLEQISTMDFAPLNVMILQRSLRDLPSPLGLKEAEIFHSRGLITKDEVRAATLHRLNLPVSGIFWDVGAGSGSVSIEAARLCPGLAVYAIEKNGDELAHIKNNIRHHKAYNVRVASGRAPDVLNDLPDPDRVFVGGSGGELASIIRVAAERLSDEGKIVVNGVIEKTRQDAPALMAEMGLVVEMSEVRVTRRSYPEQEEETVFNPITIIVGSKKRK